MPAHRSTCEADVRDAAVARLRVIRPTGRIIHEIQNACNGPNRIDLLCVTASEVIAVEVKSAKDKLDRLPQQIKAMTGSAHHVIAALHEKHLISNEKYYSNHVKFHGECRPRIAHLLNPPDEARGAEVWAWPEAGAERNRTYGCARWQEPKQAIMTPLPHAALDMLWQAELWQLCGELGILSRKANTRPVMMTQIRWAATGADITKGICRVLRRRKCCEADPPIQT